MKSLSTEQLKELHKLANAVMDQKPWTLIPEEMVFGVQLAQENAYVGFIGSMGQSIGLMAYMGEVAINRIRFLNNPETLMDTPILSVTFESEENMENHEIELMEELDLSPNNFDLFPSFRVNEPGFFPWSFSSEDADKFITILQQTLMVLKAGNFKNFADFELENQKCLYRIKQKNGKWVSSVRPIPTTKKNLVVPPSKDIIEALNKLPVTVKSVQAGCFTLPTPLGDQEKPNLGYFILILDPETEEIIAHDLYMETQRENTALNRILTTLIQGEIRPFTIEISENNRLSDLIDELKPIELPIHIKMEESLPLLESLSTDLFNSILNEEMDDDHVCDHHPES